MYKISIDFDRVTYEWDEENGSVVNNTMRDESIKDSLVSFEVNELNESVLHGILIDAFSTYLTDVQENDLIQEFDLYKFGMDKFEDHTDEHDGLYLVVYEAYVKVFKSGNDVTEMLKSFRFNNKNGFYR